MCRITARAVPEAGPELPSPRSGAPQWVYLGLVAWLALVAAGMATLWSHTLTPGQAAQAPGDWPAGSRIIPVSGQSTVLMWCHPRCPCTRASLEELEQLVRQTRGSATVQVNFVRPPGCSDAWVRGDLWRQAVAIPGVRVVVDDGRDVRQFSVHTSGQTLVFGPDRRLLFTGGLTPGRGHGGESESLIQATRRAGSGSGPLVTTPVFGCALFTDAEERLLEQRWPGERPRRAAASLGKGRS